MPQPRAASRAFMAWTCGGIAVTLITHRLTGGQHGKPKKKPEKAKGEKTKMRAFIAEWRWWIGAGYWLLLYFVLGLPTKEEYQHFEFYQSCAAASLLLITCPGIRGFWPALLFALTLLGQVLLNVFHLGPLEPEKYDAIQGILNALEFLFLFIFGGLAELRYQHESARDNRDSRSGRITAGQ